MGHAKASTTAGYVKRLGRRPEALARRAAALLDSSGGTGCPTNGHADDAALEGD